MPKQSQVIPLLVFALVIILVVLEGHEGITFSLSPDAWNLLGFIVPIGFSGGLINKALNKWREK